MVLQVPQASTNKQTLVPAGFNEQTNPGQLTMGNTHWAVQCFDSPSQTHPKEEWGNHSCRQKLDDKAVEGGEEVQVAAGAQQAQVVTNSRLKALCACMQGWGRWFVRVCGLRDMRSKPGWVIGACCRSVRDRMMDGMAAAVVQQ